MSIMHIPSDPRKFGEGAWLSIHIMAYYAITQDLQKTFCTSVRQIGSNLPCHTCRNHSNQYISDHPPENAISNDPKSMFEWSVNFHNNASIIAGHPIVDWKVAYDAYAKNAPATIPMIKGKM